MQWPKVLTTFLLLAFAITPVCWVLSGVGAITHSASSDVCEMMALHVSGQRNVYIDRELDCDSLSGARDAASDMMRASNDQVADANVAVTGAPQFSFIVWI